MDSTGESDADSSRMRTRGLHGDRESPQDTPDEQRGDGRLMEPRLRRARLIDAAVSESFFWVRSRFRLLLCTSKILI